MSASLVGSEMCIRDRAMRSPLSHCLRHSGAACLPGSRSGAGRQAAPAVSYTHLTLPTICSV
eukprot:11371658-Alexandrium_andersonii.AAC.1